MANVPTYKVCLLGNGETGKTTYIKRHLTGEFTTKYNPTLGVEVNPLAFYTNKGPIRFNIWDCAGQEQYGGLRDGYYLKADAALIFCEKRNISSVDKWIVDFKRVNPNSTIIICLNKVDLEKSMIHSKPESIKDYMFYPISSKSNYNWEKPFLQLARQFLDNDTIFVEGPPMDLPVALSSRL